MAALAWAAVLAACTIATMYLHNRLQVVERALTQGRRHLDRREYGEAVMALERGLSLARGLPFAHGQRRALGGLLPSARRAQAARDLGDLADRLRALYGADPRQAGVTPAFLGRCRAIWVGRDKLMKPGYGGLEAEAERRLRDDLLDLVILLAHLRVGLAGAPDDAEARGQGLRLLEEAEATFGPSPVLYRETQAIAEALGLPTRARDAARRAEAMPPRSAWEHYALGRLHLQSGDLDAAAAGFERATRLEPQRLWAHFYRGVCAYRRRRFDEALGAFETCVALAPESAACASNRALTHAALGHTSHALADYDRALQLDPASAPAAMNRGALAPGSSPDQGGQPGDPQGS